MSGRKNPAQGRGFIQCEEHSSVSNTLPLYRKDTGRQETTPAKTRRGAIRVFTDGLCEPTNPGGYACWAWVALDAEDHELAHAYGCAAHGPQATNNVGEYAAVIHALTWASEHALGAQLFTDSRLVANQINGDWVCNAPHLIALRDQAIELIEQAQAHIQWGPREQNKRADALTRQAYAQASRGESHANPSA